MNNQENQGNEDAFGKKFELSCKASQLSALLNAIYGGGFQSFNELDDKTKDNYLWACASLSDEVEALSSQI